MTVHTDKFFTEWVAADGVKTQWSYNFTVFTEDTMIVQIRPGLDGIIVDHTANFSFHPTNDNEGYIVYPEAGVPVESGNWIRLVRDMPYVQTVEIGNEGPFHPQIHERAFDVVTMQLQQVADAAERAIRVPLGDETDLEQLTAYLILVAQNLTNVVTVGNNIGSVNITADNIADVNAVAAKLTDIALLATNMTQILIVSGDIDDVIALAAISTQITTLAASIAEIQSVFDNLDEVTAVADNVAAVVAVSAKLTELSAIYTNLAEILAAPGIALDARDMARLWAIEAEGVLVDDGDHAPGYSAYHWAKLAEFLVIDPWANQPIGVPIGVLTHLEASLAPPKGNYIKLTAGETGAGQYNEGLLISETISGVSPNLTATAEINAPGSILHGKTVPLLNTEETFLRPGVSGALQNSQNLAHDHTASTNSAGAHTHTVSAYINSSAGSSPVSYGAGATFQGTTTSSAGAHSHTVTVNSSGSSEARPRNRGATFYMRIK